MLKDILRDTWAFQELMQEGREVGLQEGREVGLQEGRTEERQHALTAERQTLLLYIQARFPNLLTLAEQQSPLLTTPEDMQALMRKVIISGQEEEIRQALLEIQAK